MPLSRFVNSDNGNIVRLIRGSPLSSIRTAMHLMWRTSINILRSKVKQRLFIMTFSSAPTIIFSQGSHNRGRTGRAYELSECLQPGSTGMDEVWRAQEVLPTATDSSCSPDKTVSNFVVKSFRYWREAKDSFSALEGLPSLRLPLDYGHDDNPGPLVAVFPYCDTTLLHITMERKISYEELQTVSRSLFQQAASIHERDRVHLGRRTE